MSEFSESFHLSADRIEAGADLLRTARVAGWVYPPVNGWVTVVPDAEFGQAPTDALAAATRELLVHYLNAEDHGWWFTAWFDGRQLARYAAEWDDEIEVDASAVDPAHLADVLQQGGHDVAAADLAAALAPPSFDDLMAAFGDNPGHRFARLLGFGHFEWLSGPGLRADARSEPDAVRVD